MFSTVHRVAAMSHTLCMCSLCSSVLMLLCWQFKHRCERVEGEQKIYDGSFCFILLAFMAFVYRLPQLACRLQSSKRLISSDLKSLVPSLLDVAGCCVPGGILLSSVWQACWHHFVRRAGAVAFFVDRVCFVLQTPPICSSPALYCISTIHLVPCCNKYVRLFRFFKSGANICNSAAMTRGSAEFYRLII